MYVGFRSNDLYIIFFTPSITRTRGARSSYYYYYYTKMLLSYYYFFFDHSQEIRVNVIDPSATSYNIIIITKYNNIMRLRRSLGPDVKAV